MLLGKEDTLKTALIVLNYNDKENTINYVNVMKSYECIDKIIVVDNKSTREDELQALQELENDKVDVIVSDKNGGYAYGNNFGVKYLEKKYKCFDFEYVIISNPDVSVDEDTINKCLRHLRVNKDVAIVAPRMYFTNGPARRSAWKERKFFIDVANSTRITELLFYPIFKKGEYSKKDYEESILNVDCVAGSFFLAKIQALKEVKYLDENTFLFYEEDILSKKLKRNGYRLHLLTELKFVHYESQCIGKIYSLFRKQKLIFNSRKYYHKTYQRAGKLRLLIFDILHIIRMMELLIEVPILKLLKGNKK